jgi:hypothetical protein
MTIEQFEAFFETGNIPPDSSLEEQYQNMAFYYNH